ncbi:MAG: peptidyl-prolyl cis-trans isomerase [Candidatus Eisenbacteria bacterium]
MTSVRRDGGRRRFAASPALVLVAWAATFGIWLGSCGRPTGVESPASGDPLDDLVLARLGDRTIQVRDLLYKIKIQLPAMMGAEGMTDLKQKRQVLQQTLNQYAWVYLAEKNGWDRDQEFQATLELSRKYILSNRATQKAVYDKLEIPEPEIRAYYDENQDQFIAPPHLSASVVLCDTQAQAQDIARRARAGEDFAALATRYSTHKISKDLGGRLGTIAPGVDVKGFPDLALTDKVLELGEGEVSDPIQTTIGWAVFRAYDRVDTRVRDYAEVQEVIRQKLYEKTANTLFSEVLDKTKTETNGAIDEAAWIRYSATLLSEDQLMSLAGSLPDAQGKIGYYRALVENHPASTYAPQAQFMVGFTLADDLRDYDGARTELERMVKEYPDDELVASARWLLDHLGEGLSDQEQVKEIRERMKGGKGTP